jgi:hypothetical protein
MLADDFVTFLPALPAIARGWHNCTRDQAGVVLNPQHCFNCWNHDPATPVNVNNASAANQGAASISPGISIELQTTRQHARNYQQAYRSRCTLPPYPRNTAFNNWNTYLALNDGMEWLPPLIRMASKVATHWQGSTTLENISTMDGPTPLNITTGQAVFPDRDAHRDALFNVDDFPLTEVIVTNVYNNEKPPAEKLAAISQTNFRMPLNFGPNDDGNTDNGNVRDGPYWRRAPVTHSSEPFNPRNSLLQVIETEMFISRPRT